MGYTVYLSFRKNTRYQTSTSEAVEEFTTKTVTQRNYLIQKEIKLTETTCTTELQRIQRPKTITIAYASTTGTCMSFAKNLHATLSKILAAGKASQIKTVVQICSVDELDWWDEILNNETTDDAKIFSDPPPIVIFILPTWTNGTLPTKYATLLSSLHEISHDWRVAPRPLRNELAGKSHKNDTRTLQIACFGMGSTAYDISTFCKPSKDVFKYFMKLGARSLLVSNGRSVVGTGDDDAGDCRKIFKEWMVRVVHRVEALYSISREEKNVSDSQRSTECCQGDNSSGCGCQEEKIGEAAGESTLHPNGHTTSMETLNEDNEYTDSEDESEGVEPELMDLEDIGDTMQASANEKNTKGVKEMVTVKQAAALKKEGYKIIGTHSAVKLCRWTKHQLRGRGGCYKHTFYGITSYQCMETTPSLACANKCVFCWRHHKNPVGREWRWKTDDPYEIVDKAVKMHVSMIKEAKGIPGVKMDRWKDAHTVRHCALSLVGEPVMYPRINEFLGELHNRSISTFLVTNGQHPSAIESLRPITQLYVSIDASTPETLEAIDRPLFKDAWERLKLSLKYLKKKHQRTVARLTVVKGWNSDEVEGYAKLVALGQCSFVELKGVTFCGKSDASNLNMSNSPWHHEVVSLAQNLQKALYKLRTENFGENAADLIPEYDIACAHQHSCSVLLARVDQFAVDDPVTGRRIWRTWINYDKFQQLVARNAVDPSFNFEVEDYLEDTPAWALFGSQSKGFDPTEIRHRKKRKHPKYTRFDLSGVPTHDHAGKELDQKERERLLQLMEERKKEIGNEASVIEMKGGEKNIFDASLMFRGMVIAI